MSKPAGIRSFEFLPEQASLAVDCGLWALSIRALNERMIRVRAAAGANFLARRPWAVNRPDEDFPVPETNTQETESVLMLEAGQFAAAVERDTGKVMFVDTGGNIFAADFSSVDLEQGIRLAKRIYPGEHFYGFGERTGHLEKSWRLHTNWTTDPARPHGPGVDPLYIAMPVYLSVQPGLAYAVYLNNTTFSSFDLRQPGTLFYQARGGELDYYVSYGPTPQEALQALTEVLGRMPLPPRWALGYHQSRWSYPSAGVVRELAQTFRARDLPCDAIHLDIDYMHGFRVFTWDEERFPDPAGLSAELANQGFKLVTIIDPGVKVDEDFPVYKQGLEQDYFVRLANGELARGYCWPDLSVWPDFTRPDVQRWWGDLQRSLVDAGVQGVWNDMNEPAVFSLPFSQGGGLVGTLPEDAVQGPPEARTTHAEVHNLYAAGMAQASYEGLLRLKPERRPFNLCRSGFAGIQRWTASWMGDNQSLWEHLEMSLPQLLNMGLSGVPFVGVDIGGFADNASPELFARWLQAGLFFPFFRGHTSLHTAPHEPWAFGEEVEDIARRYLKLRYRLLPYLYSLFWEASQTGAPVVRPLVYHFPDDERTYHLHDQLLLGPSLMAAPVYQPGRRERMVYLPSGDWYNFWSGDRLAGPAVFVANAPLDVLPLFVRGGSILPLGPDVQYSDEKPLSPLTLEVYPGDGAFFLYEDDGESFQYREGQFALTPLRMHTHAGGLQLTIGPRQGNYLPPEREIIVRVHGVAHRPAGLDPSALWEAERQLVTVVLADSSAEQTVSL